MYKAITLLTVLTATALPLTANADKPDWRYVEGGYTKMDFDGNESFEPDGLTNNNGLGLTVDVLEEIFVNRRFPSKAPVLPISLAESGKSR